MDGISSNQLTHIQSVAKDSQLKNFEFTSIVNVCVHLNGSDGNNNKKMKTRKGLRGGRRRKRVGEDVRKLAEKRMK